VTLMTAVNVYTQYQSQIILQIWNTVWFIRTKQTKRVNQAAEMNKTA
jgi:hypothetical protein